MGENKNMQKTPIKRASFSWLQFSSIGNSRKMVSYYMTGKNEA